MNDYLFQQSAAFLQRQIEAHPENAELVKAYVSLIEHRAQYEIALVTRDGDVQKNLNDNNRLMNIQWQESQASISMKRLEKGMDVGPTNFANF